MLVKDASKVDVIHSICENVVLPAALSKADKISKA